MTKYSNLCSRKARCDQIETRRNGQPPKSQLAENTNHSILVEGWLSGGWPFLLVSIKLSFEK